MPSDSGRDAVAQYLDDLLWVAEDKAVPRPIEPSRVVAIAHSPPELQQSADQTLYAGEQPLKAAQTAAKSLIAPQAILPPATSSPTAVALEDDAKTRLQALLDSEFLPRLAETAPHQKSTAQLLDDETVGADPVLDVAKVHVSPTISADLLSEPEEVTLVKWLPNGRPAWAQSRFDVLLLVVSGLVIAVPLVVLGQIYPLGQGVHQVPGQANWFMGLLNTRQGPVNILNTARYIMAERYQAEFVASAKYLVTLDNSPWGLAVDAIRQPVSLSPEDVVWRQACGQRPWLAGTVKSHLCALLDIPQLAQLLRGAQAGK